jgi:hypothetical protein
MRNHRTRVRRPSSVIAVALLALFVALGAVRRARRRRVRFPGADRLRELEAGMHAIEEGALEPFEEDRLLEALLARRSTRVTA